MGSIHTISTTTRLGKTELRCEPDCRSESARLEGAYSENTLRSYRADFAVFEQWCRQAACSALPASPETVAAFVAHDAVKSPPATLRRRLAGIRKVHRLLRLENPVEDEEVLIAMRRALRTKPRRQKKAHGKAGVIPHLQH